MTIDLNGKKFDVILEPLYIDEKLSVDFTIANNQADPTDEFNVELYLSDDDVISTDDVLLGSYQIDSLAGNSETSLSITDINLPAFDNPLWAKGKSDYYFGMIIDSQNEVAETDETNNSNTAQYFDSDKVQINFLKSSSFNIIEESLQSGNTVNLEFSIENLSQIAAKNTILDFYLSVNDNISTGDLKLGSYTIPNLAGNSDTGVLSTSFVLPPETDRFWRPQGLGNYHIGMFVDGVFRNDTSPNHNVANLDSVEVDIPNLVDLASESFNVVVEPLTSGDNFAIDFSIANLQGGTAGKFTVDFYISTNDWISKYDYKLGSYEIETLAGHSSTGNLTTHFTLPSELENFWKFQGNGTYYVGMIVNQKEEFVNEELYRLNNSNNGEYIDYDGVEVSIPPLVNLVPQFFNVIEDTYTPGTTVNVEFGVYNQNIGTANDFNVDFYISTNQYISTDDAYLGSYNISQLTGYNSTGKLTTTLDLPSFLKSGTDYYIGMIVDRENKIIETREFNSGPNFNQEFLLYDGSDSVAETAANKADLVGQTFDINPENLVAGNPVNLDFSVYNRRDTDAGTFTVDFYLSNNNYISTGDKKIGSYTIDSLKGLSSTGKLNTSFILPSGVDKFWSTKGNGTYYIGAIVDSKNQIDEFSETNNANQQELIDFDGVEVIYDQSDLQAFSFDVVQDTLVSGDSFEIKYEVTNQSVTSANQFAVGFYLFTEDYLTTHEQLSIGDVPSIYPLHGDRDSLLINLDAKTTTGEMTTSVDLPTEWDVFSTYGDGYYYIGMAVDQWDDVLEGNENNNSLQGELIDYEKVYIDVI